MSQAPSAETISNPLPHNPTRNPKSGFIPRNPQQVAVAICAVGLLIVFFGPWIESRAHVSGATLYKFDPKGLFMWAIPVLALATLLRNGDNKARRVFGTLTAITAWLCLIYFAARAQSMQMSGWLAADGHEAVALDDFPRLVDYLGFLNSTVSGLAWGGSLTLFFSFFLFAFSEYRRITAPVDLVAKRLRSRKAEVYCHWCTAMPDVHFSATEFYGELEREISAKEWPGVELVRINYSEAGLLSHKREYFRILRHRHLFDVCAATFGRDYFFSVREAEIPSVTSVRSILVLMTLTLAIFDIVLSRLGFILGSMAFLFLAAFCVWFLFNVLKLGLTRLDSILLQLPVIGPVYESWFRRETYFQQDTRLIFLHSVTELVKRHVEEITSQKGFRFLSCFERQPVLDELYRRSRMPLDGAKAEEPVTA